METAIIFTILTIPFCHSRTLGGDSNYIQFDRILGRQGEESLASAAAAESYLPNLNFWSDVGTLLLGRSGLSPIVRLSRDVFESQECAEFVSCQVSKMSRKYSPFTFLHDFLTDFPFQGDLAKRLESGSKSSLRDDFQCGYRCHPLQYLNRGIKTLNLLHDVMANAVPPK